VEIELNIGKLSEFGFSLVKLVKFEISPEGIDRIIEIKSGIRVA
jgi:hypothetical protein